MASYHILPMKRRPYLLQTYPGVYEAPWGTPYNGLYQGKALHASGTFVRLRV